MRVSVIQADNRIVVDGVSREVDLALLDVRIHAITYNTERGIGAVEYDEGATEQVEVRDFEAEKLAADEARRLNQPVPTATITKIESVAIANKPFTDWEVMRPYYELWLAAAPALPPPPTPAELAAIEEEKVLAAELDNEVRTVTLGTVEPKTLAELRAMRRAAFRAWFVNNYSTAVQIRNLVGWILFQLVRRF